MRQCSFPISTIWYSSLKFNKNLKLTLINVPNVTSNDKVNTTATWCSIRCSISCSNSLMSFTIFVTVLSLKRDWLFFKVFETVILSCDLSNGRTYDVILGSRLYFSFLVVFSSDTENSFKRIFSRPSVYKRHMVLLLLSSKTSSLVFVSYK